MPRKQNPNILPDNSVTGEWMYGMSQQVGDLWQYSRTYGVKNQDRLNR